MKHFLQSALIGGALLWAASSSAQYCTPPNFTSGPYTGILSVRINDIDHQSFGTDGYSDYTNLTTDVMRGNEPHLFVTLEHTIINVGFSDSLALRVWVDWNQDEDFTDPGEEVIAQNVDLSADAGSTGSANVALHFTVPMDAALGSTRMRVYEDMLEIDGHQAPNPCGYSNGVGQHGEVEDYTLNVIEAITSVQEVNPYRANLYPNPSTGLISLKTEKNNLQHINIYNLLGEQVMAVSSSGLLTTIDAAHLAAGRYMVQLRGDAGVSTMPLVIVR